jgi:hypothetical protein
MRLLKMTIALCATLALANVDAQAADTSYNPDRLPDAQLAQVADLCVNVMGLNPQEGPVGGVYRGTPHLDDGVNHYQACVAALSDSLQDVAAANGATRVKADCRAKGLASGSSGFAECVLRGIDSASRMKATTSTPAGTGDAVSAAAVGSTATEAAPATRPTNFFLDSPSVTRSKEETACARLGLVPPGGEFAKCVRLLHDNFFAIDNPIS